MSATAQHAKNKLPSRILVVDPRQVDYDWLVRWVVANQGQVRFLATARAALRQRHNPAADLCLINVRLPDLNGCDLVEMLRPFPPGAAVFLVADEYAVADEVRALGLGVSGYLCKPLEPSLLCEYGIGKRDARVASSRNLTRLEGEWEMKPFTVLSAMSDVLFFTKRSLKMKKFAVLSAMLAVLFFAATAHAIQFDTLASGYAQEIFAGPLTPNQEAGMAWTSSNHLLTRAGSTIVEYGLTQNNVYNGTNNHSSIATHPIAGLLSTGYGITNGLDGYIYAATGSGLQRFNPVTWSAAQSLAGTVGGNGWGITTLPDGRIAYSDGAGASNIYVYNPSAGTNQWIYTANVQVDDIEAGPTGEIALAGHSGPGSIIIISNSGTPINSFLTTHFPDGLAFGDGAASNALFSNNNDGSISKYAFVGPGYSGAPTITDIALQTLPSGKAYGDLAAVGPDCAFYVSQYSNSGGGATPGVGTHWDNGVTTADASIIRISAVGSDGTPICGFHSPTADLPEPGSLLLVLAGLVSWFLRTCWVQFARSRKNAT